jgi:hypothetical protein
MVVQASDIELLAGSRPELEFDAVCHRFVFKDEGKEAFIEPRRLRLECNCAHCVFSSSDG